MNDKNNNWSRRDFMKIAGAAGVGAVVSPMGHLTGAVAKSESDVSAQGNVARRPFGMSGTDVSILTLGGTVNFLSNQLLLRQALKMGVTCWDTSSNYIGGKSEKGIGKYFNKFPDDRKKIFLDATFHLQIAEMAKNRILKWHLKINLEHLYLRAKLDNYDTRQMENAAIEHHLLVKKMKNKDVLGSVEIMRHHIISCRDHVIACLSDNDLVDEVRLN